jgi:transposase
MIREYTYAYGAVCPFEGNACYLILPAMSGLCMNLFLQELAARYTDHYLLVVYDGAPCHSPGALTLPGNMIVVTLPPYRPELNPTENNWDDMREKFFKNFLFNSLDAVEDQLVTACLFYEQHPHIIQSMTAWNWIINY